MRRAVAEVDLLAVRANASRLADLAAPAELCAVVKADGYGHGAVPVSRAVLVGGAARLAVATADEALSLRDGGITAPILVLGALGPEELATALAARAEVVAWRDAFVREVADASSTSSPTAVHVKLDTGLGRLGTRSAVEATAVADLAAGLPGTRLVGLMSHLATAESPDPAFMREQLAVMTSWAEGLVVRHGPLVRHIANTAATVSEPAARLDMVRCGIGLYGISPFGDDPAGHGLRPAMAVRSYLAEVKLAEPGQSVGYGRRYVARRPMWIGTVPIGYADGIRRAFHPDGQVLIAGHRRRVAGAVSMDNLGVELGPADGPDAEAAAAALRGASVTLLGSDGGDRILAEEHAVWLGTIGYEVVCGIGPRVPRIHLGEQG